MLAGLPRIQMQTPFKRPSPPPDKRWLQAISMRPKEALRGIRGDRAERERPSPEERLQNVIDRIQQRIEDGELPEGADADAIQAAITAAGQALAAGNLDAAKEALRGIRGDRAERERPSPEERIQSVIDRIQQRIEDGLPDGVRAEAVRAAIDAAKAALADGDLQAAREALAALRGDRHDADRNGRDRGDQGQPDRDDHGDNGVEGRPEGGMAERINAMRAAILRNAIERIQQAIETRGLPDGVDAEQIRTRLADAIAALRAGDVDTAREALRGLLPQRPNGDADGENGGDELNDPT